MVIYDKNNKVNDNFSINIVIIMKLLLNNNYINVNIDIDIVNIV